MAPMLDHDEQGNGAHPDQPRFLIVGAGSRGNSYARALVDSGLGIVAAVADPIAFKRTQLGSKYIWQNEEPSTEQEFADWRDYLGFEQQRRKDQSAGLPVAAGIDGVFICVLDHQHVEVASALGPLGLHIMCEKPLATRLDDCLRIHRSIEAGPRSIFAIGHVLRYSPHNMLLRHMLLEQRAIGDILSLEHTEPVGWWHFSHSYVRGNWRKESSTAPSLLTKSCHDIDFILWLLCSPTDAASKRAPHLPSTVSSAGSLKQFTRSRKPKEAGDATNCTKCPIVDSCAFSARKIYYDRHLAQGKSKWPVDIVNPEVDALHASGKDSEAKDALLTSLAEDYTNDTPNADIESRPWYGRCVWECDNDVVDDQYVTFEWDDSDGRSAKTANFHMIAQTLAQCERRGRVYGTSGEISYDSKSITVHDFTANTTQVYHPEVPKNSHHGGGDDGLTQQFAKAVAAAKSGEMSVNEAQIKFMGCTIEEVVRSHAAVFAAEEARLQRKVVNWHDWWSSNVAPSL